MQDDELREALRESREPDRESAPSFGTTWGEALERSGRRRWRVWAGAVAVAAAIAAVIVFWPDATHQPELQTDTIAETEPQPDIPLDEPVPDDTAADDWTAEALAETPTDFLLEEPGYGTSNVPSDAFLDDDVLDFDDESLREL